LYVTNHRETAFGYPWNMHTGEEQLGELFLADGSPPYAVILEGVRLKFGPDATGQINWSGGDQCLWKANDGSQAMVRASDVCWKVAWFYPLPRAFRPYRAGGFGELEVVNLQRHLRMDDRHFVRFTSQAEQHVHLPSNLHQTTSRLPQQAPASDPPFIPRPWQSEVGVARAVITERKEAH